MNKIKIIDSCMGSGKTSWAIQYMNENVDKKFIYVTPFIEQTERVKESCYNRVFRDPDAAKGKGSKLEHLRILIENGCNISTTHALFRYIDKDIINKIKEMNYTLILDEVINIIEKYKISKEDMRMLINEGHVRIEDDTNRIFWNEEKQYDDGKFDNEKKLLVNGDCYISTRTSEKSKEEILIWTFPVSIFESFEEIFVMTYLFEAQYQYSYYKLNNIDFEYYSVENNEGRYSIVDYKKDDISRFKKLIHICENEKLNMIGLKKGKDNPLSVSWYKKCVATKSDSLDVIKANIRNYTKNICKAKSSDIIWTTFKEYKSKIKGEGYSKAFIPINCRATNDYKDRTTFVYCANLFMNPSDKGFFDDRDIEINQDAWALSELLQVLFRSAIREDKEINVYIPSSRMRKLLQDWVDEKSDTQKKTL